MELLFYALVAVAVVGWAIGELMFGKEVLRGLHDGSRRSGFKFLALATLLVDLLVVAYCVDDVRSSCLAHMECGCMWSEDFLACLLFGLAFCPGAVLVCGVVGLVNLIECMSVAPLGMETVRSLPALAVLLAAFVVPFIHLRIMRHAAEPSIKKALFVFWVADWPIVLVIF